MTFVALVALGLSGCPRDPDDPLPPAEARPCVTDEDCRPAGAPCGLVWACVDVRCTEQPSRAVPCDD